MIIHVNSISGGAVVLGLLSLCFQERSTYYDDYVYPTDGNPDGLLLSTNIYLPVKLLERLLL